MKIPINGRDCGWLASGQLDPVLSLEAHIGLIEIDSTKFVPFLICERNFIFIATYSVLIDHLFRDDVL